MTGPTLVLELRSVLGTGGGPDKTIILGARALNGGKLENARIVESLTALLIGINMRYKVHSAGIRFTGLPIQR